jgi:hypothetical protein
MRVLKTEDCFYIAGGMEGGGGDASGSEGGFSSDGYGGETGGGMSNAGYSGAGCTKADTEASCAARTSGYETCDKAGDIATRAADKAFGPLGEIVASAITDVALGICKTGVDAVVNANFATEMREKAIADAEAQRVDAGGSTSNYGYYSYSGGGENGSN